jgi:hypothetical protein
MVAKIDSELPMRKSERERERTKIIGREQPREYVMSIKNDSFQKAAGHARNAPHSLSSMYYIYVLVYN